LKLWYIAGGSAGYSRMKMLAGDWDCLLQGCILAFWIGGLHGIWRKLYELPVVIAYIQRSQLQLSWLFIWW
jgi:hypothetical protein